MYRNWRSQFSRFVGFFVLKRTHEIYKKTKQKNDVCFGRSLGWVTKSTKQQVVEWRRGVSFYNIYIFCVDYKWLGILETTLNDTTPVAKKIKKNNNQTNDKLKKKHKKTSDGVTPIHGGFFFINLFFSQRSN